MWLVLDRILIYRISSFVQGVSGNYPRSETYIDIVTNGKGTQALLDSGCDRNLCPRRLCRNAVEVRSFRRDSIAFRDYWP